MAKKKTLLQQITEAKNNVAKFIQGKNNKPVIKKATSTFLKVATANQNPVLKTLASNYKQVQNKAADVGRFLQKTPDTTIKIQPPKKGDAKWIKGRQQIGPVSLPVSGAGAKALPFISSIPGEAIRSYGRTAERLNTSKGRREITGGVKDLVQKDIPRIAKDPKNALSYLDLLKNPAVQTGLDVSDVVPGLGVGSIGIKSFWRRGAKEGAEKAAKTKVIKAFEPGVKSVRGLLSSKEVYLIDEFSDWVGKTGGNSLKAYKEIDPRVLDDMVLMTKAAFGKEAANTWNYKKMSEAWQYVFKRLTEGKRVPVGLETEDISENFAKQGGKTLLKDQAIPANPSAVRTGTLQGNLAQTQQAMPEESLLRGTVDSTNQLPSSSINPVDARQNQILQKNQQLQSQLNMPPQTRQAIATQTVPNRPMNPNVPSSPSSPSSISPDVKFPQKPQELNVNRLDLTPEQKAHIVSLESQELRQKLGDKEIMKLARDAGIDTRTYDIDQTAKKIAEQLNVRRDIVTLEKQLAQTTDETAREKIIKKIADQSRISRTQGTDIARQLSARRIIANELDTPMQRVFKLLDNAGVNPEVYIKKAKTVDFNNPQAVINFYRELVPAKWHEWMDVVRYNSMLSSPRTQLVNMFGNAVNTSMVAPVEKTLTGIVDLFSSKLTGKDQSRFAGEGLAYAGGYVKNSKKAVNRLIEVMQGKSPMTNLDLRYAPVATKGFKGKVAKTLEVPTKLMEAFDQFFMALTEGGEKASLDYIKKRGGKIVGDAAITANENAKYRLFRQVLGDKSQGQILDAMDYIPKTINAARNSKNPVTRTIARFTFPFISTPTNIAKQGIEYSPVGFSTMFGAKNKTEQFTKALMGTMATAGAATLLGSGRLSWAEPTDPDERAAFRAAGQQPYSVKLGDKWVDYRNLPPLLSFNLAMISSLDDALKTGKTDQGTVDRVLLSAAKMGNFFADKTYFKQMGDLLAATKGDPEAFGRAVSNYPQQLIPFRAFGGWLARMLDDTQRKVDYSQDFINEQMQILMLNIPGMSQKVNPRLDPQGNPIKSQHRFFNAFSPLNVSTEIKDKLVFLAEQKNAMSLYGFLKGMDKGKANTYAEDLAERRPELYNKLTKFKAIDDAGLGLPEYEMVGTGIKDGTRANLITTQLNQLPTKAEKNAYIDKLYELGIMDEDDKVYDQLIKLKEQGKLKAPTDAGKPQTINQPQPEEEIEAPKSIINSETAPITQEFGAWNPEIEIFSGGTNYGTDFGVGEDTELSLPDGVWEVVDAYDGDDMNSGYGKSIMVENRRTGERIRLSHLNDVLVDKGEMLRGGNTIGFSGSTGNSTGPHVDVEYYDKDGNIGDILRSQYAKNL